ncbi:MAG: IPT/TIG domain-containing protein, partial [Phycisphaerae bacterium]
MAVTTTGGTATAPNAFTYILPTPTGVSASQGTSTAQVTVNWSAVNGATGYDVFRDSAPVKIGSSSGVTTTFNDTTAVPGTLYSYTIKATSATGNSEASSAATGFRKLSPPTGIIASQGTKSTQINLIWSETPGATSYQIFRNGATTPIGTSESAFYADTSAPIGTTCNYTLKALCTLSTSDMSSPAVTGWRAPEAPIDVSATKGTSSTQVTVTWIAVDGATGYDIFRDAGATKIGTTFGKTSVTFNDTTAVPMVEYSYTVKATAAAGVGPASEATPASIGFRAMPAPTISSVSPTSGTTLGGTAITITGSSFTDASSVTVGGAAATSVVVVSSTSITAITPAGTAGAQSVAVTTSVGTA